LRPKVPNLAALMDEAEPDVLAYSKFATVIKADLWRIGHARPEEA
jgi:hypothetical protein